MPTNGEPSLFEPEIAITERKMKLNQKTQNESYSKTVTNNRIKNHKNTII